MYMRIVSFFKSVFRKKKSFQNNADDFDWDAYEKAVAEDIPCALFMNVRNC